MITWRTWAAAATSSRSRTATPRNYLLPRKLALPATPGNLKVVERQRKIADAAEAGEKAGAEALAVRLTKAECVMARRVGEHETLYGSVTAADIAEELAAKGFHIDKHKIQLAEPIKHLGEFSVAIRIHRDAVAHVPVKVTPLKHYWRMISEQRAQRENSPNKKPLAIFNHYSPHIQTFVLALQILGKKEI